MLNKVCSKVEVLTIAQVLNFEDEMVRSTDVSKAQDLTKSETVSDMKRAVNRMKDAEFRQALKRHKFDLFKLWTKKPPKAFSFIRQQAEEIAQQIRKNSRPESVEKVVSKAIKFRMELEGLNAPFDEEACKRYSGWILSAIKNQK